MHLTLCQVRAAALGALISLLDVLPAGQGQGGASSLAGRGRALRALRNMVGQLADLEPAMALVLARGYASMVAAVRDAESGGMEFGACVLGPCGWGGKEGCYDRHERVARMCSSSMALQRAQASW
jgi:hypothetical protein